MEYVKMVPGWLKKKIRSLKLRSSEVNSQDLLGLNIHYSDTTLAMCRINKQVHFGAS